MKSLAPRAGSSSVIFEPPLAEVFRYALWASATFRHLVMSYSWCIISFFAYQTQANGNRRFLIRSHGLAKALNWGYWLALIWEARRHAWAPGWNGE